jgi:hypothetical protein
MHLATAEEAPLHEVLNGSVDLLPAGSVTHGPWPAAACAAVLSVWHDAGLIGLYFSEPPPAWNVAPADWCARLLDDGVLTGPDAKALLNHPERWTLEQADGHACPYRTEKGQATPWLRWHELALETARRSLLIQHDPED